MEVSRKSKSASPHVSYDNIIGEKLEVGVLGRSYLGEPSNHGSEIRSVLTQDIGVKYTLSRYLVGS